MGLGKLVGAVVAKQAHRPGFATAGARLAPLDRALGGATDGRRSLSRLLGVPHLHLTTVGARTGYEHAVTVVYARDSDNFVVAGTHWGRPGHPDWTYNLMATPQARVALGGELFWVTGQLVESPSAEDVRKAKEEGRELADERARLWKVLTGVWPAAATHQGRSQRPCRVFLLDPG
ncbi:MAG: nitroreductase/quinone reductase family protein [Mycobacteriales bacterium]